MVALPMWWASCARAYWIIRPWTREVKNRLIAIVQLKAVNSVTCCCFSGLDETGQKQIATAQLKAVNSVTCCCFSGLDETGQTQADHNSAVEGSKQCYLLLF